MRVLAATIVLVAAALWSSDADADRPCTVSQRAQTLVRTPDGVLYARHNHAFGCLNSTGRTRRLPAHGSGNSVLFVAFGLSGRFAAYVVGEGDYEDVTVADLRSGRTIVTQQASPTFARDVKSLVVKRNGSVAWIAQGGGYSPEGMKPCSCGAFEVHRVSARRPGRDEMLAKGVDINPKSLRLVNHRRQIAWREGGRRHLASLR
jgi:hypothetical protein